MADKIKEKWENFENILLNNNMAIILVFLSFLKPLSLYYFNTINSIYNIWMALTGLVVSTVYFRRYVLKRDVSGIQKAVMFFMATLLISTIMGTKNFSSYIKTYFKWLSISVYTEMLIKNNLDGLLKNLSNVIFSYIIINIISMFIFPQGIANPDGLTPVFFLGNDNTTTLTLVLGSLFIIFKSYYMYEKLDKMSIISVVLVTFLYVRDWSVTALISTFILIFYICFLYKRNKKQKIFNYRNYIIVGLIFFVAVVLLRVQYNFKDVIEATLHKGVDFTGRTLIWDNCLSYIKQRPLFGLGVDEFEIRENKIQIFHAHCLYLNILLEGGIISLISFYSIFFTILKNMNKAVNNEIKNIISFAFLIYFISGLVEVYQDSQLIYIFMVMAYFINIINERQTEKTMFREKSKNERKKILVVISGGLPIPSVKGGAVETLIDMFLDENEKLNKYDFEVYSRYDADAEVKGKEYKYCKFNYIHVDNVKYKIERVIRSVAHKILHLPVDFVFVSRVIKDIEKNKKNYDLVIVENNASLVNPLSRKFRGKIILHLHNDNLNIDERDGRETFDNCKRIYTVSNYIKGRVETIEKSDKVVTLYNGINIEMFTKNSNNQKRNEIRQKYGINDNEIVFVFGGRVCKDKGVKELIQAFNLAHEKNPNIKLMIVGGSFFSSKKKTKYIKKLINIAEKNKKDIIFTGYINYNDMSNIYNMADVQVVPSMFDDPCPLTVIEGMVMGLPQIVTQSGGIPEEVGEKNAIKIDRKNIVQDFSEAMVYLAKEKEIRKEMSELSKERAKLFDMQIYNYNFYKLIEEEFE